GGIPTGRKGNPNIDEDWFGTDWMDTTRSAEALNFQRISWPQLLAETAERMGWRRYPARPGAPPAPPPLPPPGTEAEFVDGLPIGGGVRVPAFIVSPWSIGGYVATESFDH